MDFSRPVDLPVSSPFGQRSSGFHAGIDYSDGVEGHPIHAVGDGVVVFNAFEGDGLGWTVTIQHDGIKSGYGHMREQSPFALGTPVRLGDIVGFVGNTGSSTGPHLHLWMGQNPNTLAVDPAPLLTGAADDLTPGQAAKLDVVHELLVVGRGGTPSLDTLIRQIHGSLFGVAFAVPPLLDRIRKVVEGAVKR